MSQSPRSAPVHNPLPDADASEGENRDEPAGAGVQSEANDGSLRHPPADPGHGGLIDLTWLQRRPDAESVTAFLHGLGPKQTLGDSAGYPAPAGKTARQKLRGLVGSPPGSKVKQGANGSASTLACAQLQNLPEEH